MEKSKRELQKENTRNKIIEAAFRVYSKNGFTASTGLVAKEAGVAHGSVFLHFPTLDSLIVCISGEFADGVCAKLEDLSEYDGNIEGLLAAHANILAECEDFYARLITEAPLLPEEAAVFIGKIQTCFAVHFNRVINREIEAGVLKKLPAQILLNAWVGLIHHYIQNRNALSPGAPVLKRYKNQLIFTFCEMLRKQ